MKGQRIDYRYLNALARECVNNFPNKRMPGRVQIARIPLRHNREGFDRAAQFSVSVSTRFEFKT
jgi:hypothetical protein